MPLERLLVSSSNFPGHRFSEDTGDESDFREYQNYVPGEDPKRMDWKVFARTDHKVIKKFSSEKSRNVYLCLDCSASIGNQGSEIFRELFYYVMMYLYLKNECFGLILLKGKDFNGAKVMSSGAGPEHFKKMEQFFFEITYEGTSELVEPLRPVVKQLERNSEILYFSDFQYALPEFKEIIDLVYWNHLHLNIIAFFNHRVVSFSNPQQSIWLKGDETLTRKFLDKGLMKEYQHLVMEHYQELSDLAKRYDVTYTMVDSREGILDSFIKLFK